MIRQASHRRITAPPKPYRKTEFAYDAATASNRRRITAPILRSEDFELLPQHRKQLVASQHDIARNYTVARWMIERHLDYVTSFEFQSRTGDETLDSLVESKFSEWSQPQNCDVAKRHSFRAGIRLMESSAVRAGDVLPVRLSDGRIQWVEGDRIATPSSGLPLDLDPTRIVHGVLIDDYGAAEGYVVCRRGQKGAPHNSPTSLVFEDFVSAEDARLHGFFDRFDQVRGVSPLACALNPLQDSYEATVYALGRMKIDQLFGLSIFRQDPNRLPETEETQDYTQLPIAKQPQFILDLDPGDRAEFLESSQPSTQFQSFMRLSIQLCLKALAIPFSFFDESFTNYSGARQALLQYQQAADLRRNSIRQQLDEITRWRWKLFIEDSELPRIDEKDIRFEWVATGLPWIDPLKEVQAQLAALSAGLDSRTNILKRSTGREFVDVVTELAAESELLKSHGLPTTTSPDNALIAALITEQQPVAGATT